MIRRFAVALLLVACARPVLASDQIVELVTGMPLLSKPFDLGMESRLVRVGLETVLIETVYANSADQPVSEMVVFPLPELDGGPIASLAADVSLGDNFLDVAIKVDGKRVEPVLTQRASLLGADITDALKAAGVPLLPGTRASGDAIARLPAETLAEWTKRGWVAANFGEDGDGRPQAMWQLQSALWWMMEVPAGGKVTLTITHRTSLGASTFADFARPDAEAAALDAARAQYCTDEAFLAAAAKTSFSSDGGRFDRYGIELGLNLVASQALNIGRFTLEVDKGKPTNLVSFCGAGVKKTGPTTFSMTATDYTPPATLPIMILGE